MPANNSKTNRSIRRTAALERFVMNPTRSDSEKASRAARGLDEGYAERKAVEKTALENHGKTY